MGAGPVSTGNSIADLVIATVGPQIRERAESVVREQVEIVIREGRARLDEEAKNYGALVENAVGAVLAQPAAPSTPPSVKADARERSWRTLVQGLIATVIVSVGGGVATAIAEPGFDILSSASLTTAAAAGGTAAIAAILSYVQRLVQPPKV
jgi:O-acetyl-ADP-ribose deacetylase (regulator of RNase III)